MSLNLRKQARDFLKLLAKWRDSGKLEGTQHEVGLLAILEEHKHKLEPRNETSESIPHSPIKIEGRKVTRKGKDIESD